MDTNRDRDIDVLLKKALKNPVIPKPDIELVNRTKSGLKIKEDERNLNKSTVKRTIGRAAAIVVVAMLAITTTAFAAGVYLGSFDRLREIIGGERADLLQPIGVSNLHEEHTTGNIDFPNEGLANGNSNGPSGSNAGSGINEFYEHGIRVELVAVGVFDNVVDIYVTLEDTIGNRLDGDFQVGHFIVRAEGAEVAAIGTSPEIIGRTADGVVTIRSRETFPYSVAGLELTYILTGITYNFSEPQRPRQLIDLTTEMDFGLSEVISQPYLPFITDMPTVNGGGSWDVGRRINEIEEQMRTVGFPVLEPHLHDITLNVGSAEIIISSIGIVDGNLHIQWVHNYSNRTSHFIVMDSQDDWLDRVGFGFSLDSYGNVYNSNWEGGIPPYMEDVFIIEDLSRISEYRLGVIYSPEFSYDRIPLSWSVTFEVERNDAQVIADNLNIQHEGAVITEIRVSPFLVHVKIEASDDVFYSTQISLPQIVIHTENGTVEAVQSGGIVGRSDTGDVRILNFFYDVSAALDLDSIISIEIAEESVTIS